MRLIFASVAFQYFSAPMKSSSRLPMARMPQKYGLLCPKSLVPPPPSRPSILYWANPRKHGANISDIGGRHGGTPSDA